MHILHGALAVVLAATLACNKLTGHVEQTGETSRVNDSDREVAALALIAKSQSFETLDTEAVRSELRADLAAIEVHWQTNGQLTSERIGLLSRASSRVELINSEMASIILKIAAR